MGYYATIYGNSYLAHHGIKGQKWGVRRYQNADGSLTAAGYQHYYGNHANMDSAERREFKSAMKADRNAWKKRAKENYKNVKLKAKYDGLSKDSEEYKNASRDRYMAKHGTKEGIDKYRYGTKEEKNAAIKQAGNRKAGKIATEAALATAGALTVAGTAVGAVAIADAIAKAGLVTLGTAAGAGTLGVGVAASMGNKKGVNQTNDVSAKGDNIKRYRDQKKNVRYNADRSMMTRGTGLNEVTYILKSELKKDNKGNIVDPENQKRRIFGELDSTMRTLMYDNNTKNEMDKTRDVKEHQKYIDGYSNRMDSVIDNLKELGVSDSEINSRISNNITKANSYDPNWDIRMDYDYNKRHQK